MNELLSPPDDYDGGRTPPDRTTGFENKPDRKRGTEDYIGKLGEDIFEQWLIMHHFAYTRTEKQNGYDFIVNKHLIEVKTTDMAPNKIRLMIKTKEPVNYEGKGKISGYKNCPMFADFWVAVKLTTAKTGDIKGFATKKEVLELVEDKEYHCKKKLHSELHPIIELIQKLRE